MLQWSKKYDDKHEKTYTSYLLEIMCNENEAKRVILVILSCGNAMEKIVHRTLLFCLIKKIRACSIVQ